MTKAQLEMLARKVKAMSFADQLRLAAGLLDNGQTEMATSIARRVVDMLDAKRLGISVPSSELPRR